MCCRMMSERSPIAPLASASPDRRPAPSNGDFAGRRPASLRWRRRGSRFTGSARTGRGAMPLRHGLTAETLIVTIEDEKDYRAFERSVLASYAPATAVGRELSCRLASLLWAATRHRHRDRTVLDSSRHPARTPSARHHPVRQHRPDGPTAADLRPGKRRRRGVRSRRRTIRHSAPARHQRSAVLPPHCQPQQGGLRAHRTLRSHALETGRANTDPAGNRTALGALLEGITWPDRAARPARLDQKPTWQPLGSVLNKDSSAG